MTLFFSEFIISRFLMMVSTLPWMNSKSPMIPQNLSISVLFQYTFHISLSLFLLFKLSFSLCSSFISEKEIADSPVPALPDCLFLNFATAATSYLCPFLCLHFQSLLLSSDYSLPFVFSLYYQPRITEQGPVIMYYHSSPLSLNSCQL